MEKINVLDYEPADLYLALHETNQKAHPYYHLGPGPVTTPDLTVDEAGHINYLLILFKILESYLKKDDKEVGYCFYESDDESSDCDENKPGTKKPKLNKPAARHNLTFLAVLYRAHMKKKWISSWCNKDSKVEDWITSTIEIGGKFRVNVAAVLFEGSYSIGVLIRDSWGRPIVAYSRETPSDQTRKTHESDDDDDLDLFEEEIEGVNQGLRLCMEYGLKKDVRISVNSESAVGFIRTSWSQGPKAFEAGHIMEEVVNRIKTIGLSGYDINPCPSRINISAKWLARLRVKEGLEMKPADLNDHPEFLNILYEEASGERGMTYFRM